MSDDRKNPGFIGFPHTVGSTVVPGYLSVGVPDGMYSVPDKVRSTQTQDGAIVLAIHTGQVLRLNMAGAFIFERLQCREAEADIAKEMTAHFGIQSELAKRDLSEFLQQLEEFQLLDRNGQ